MAIKSFVAVLFVVSVLFLFSTIAAKNEQKKEHEVPLITFIDSVMYTLNEQEVSQIVKAQTAIQYKQKDEMYNGIIILRAKNEKEDFKDIIKANKIVKKNTAYSFYGDVEYDRGDFLSLRTQELFYDEATTIAYNSKPFTAIYYNDKLNGNGLYLDQSKALFKASKTHFEIAVEQAQ